MTMRYAAIAFLGALALAQPTAVQAAEILPIAFARGKTSATVSGAVVRGDRDIYSIEAKGGQTATVSIVAVEKNAVFALFQPGASVSDEGDVTGPALPRAGDGDDARRWSGRLPATGRYLVVVGGTRGNATYTLTVSLK